MDRPMDWMSEPLMAAKSGTYRPRPASTITGQLTRAEIEASGRSKVRRCHECRTGEHPNYDDDVRLCVVRDPSNQGRIILRACLCGEHRERFAADGYETEEVRWCGRAAR